MENVTAEELKALVEELTEFLVINLFKGDAPENWASETLNWIENHPAKGWGWNLSSILDLQLNGISAWDALTVEQRQIVAKEIIRHLQT
jgi:hypothetical protein